MSKLQELVEGIGWDIACFWDYLTSDWVIGLSFLFGLISVVCSCIALALVL